MSQESKQETKSRPLPQMPLAQICAYGLPGGARIERAAQLDGRVLWAVRWMENCLDQEGSWEWEPSPSSRDEAFLARCRFESPEQAYQAWAASEQAPARDCQKRG